MEMDLRPYIEHTILKPTLNQQMLEQWVSESIDNNFAGVCVPPFWVKSASRMLKDHDTSLVTVIGFPLGYQLTEIKLLECEKAIEHGANEIDMVLNMSSFHNNDNWAKIDIVKMANMCHQANTILKVIIETAYLSEEQIRNAAKICQDAGADFVKTSTGFASRGASIEDIKIIKSVVGDQLGIKASGGIRTYEQAKALIEAGADRIGCSSGIALINKLESQNKY